MRRLLLALSVALTFACVAGADSALDRGMGPRPALPEPDPSLFPTLNVARARGWNEGTTPAWEEGETPLPAPGLAVGAFAEGLDHPRWLYVLPNGDVLVAESNKPPGEGGGGIQGLIMGRMMKRAGANVPSANRITLLRDADSDGIAEVRNPFIENMNSPFGMVLVGNDLYVANTDALMRFPYRHGDLAIDDPGTKVADLPAGPINHHWTKNVIASRGGSRLYVTVGSNSNIGENGMEIEERRAAILEIDAKTGATRIFASGLRNPNGLAWEPSSGELWTTVNERDGLGDDLVPDYMTSVREGGFYGWPYSYYGEHVDERVEPRRPELVQQAIVPDYALGSHTASLGLAFSTGRALPDEFRDGAFVAQHGSWNRKPKSGYRVIFVPFDDGQPSGEPREVLTGFLDDEEEAYGRPTGLAMSREGELLVADDVGNTVWLVTGA